MDMLPRKHKERKQGKPSSKKHDNVQYPGRMKNNFMIASRDYRREIDRIAENNWAKGLSSLVSTKL
jgi:hypothetical protein